MTTARPSESESDLRQRTTTKSDYTLTSAKARSTTTRTSPFPIIDILRALVGLILLTGLSSYLVTSGESWIFNQRPAHLLSRLKTTFNGPLLLTNAQLASYDGNTPGKPILLALNRTIYDVSASPHVYGPGGMYSQLAAKDASRSYITTCFDPKDDLVPWFGGVEEIHVPLWLSRKPGQEELEAVAKEAGGTTTETLLLNVRKRIGTEIVERMQMEAYERARERVREQVKMWEGMFERKGYPAVGRVVGVDEEKERGTWEGLGFCEAARKQRPAMQESLGEAMKAMGVGAGGVDMKAKMKEAAEEVKAGKGVDGAKIKGEKAKEEILEDGEGNDEVRKGGKERGTEHVGNMEAGHGHGHGHGAGAAAGDKAHFHHAHGAGAGVGAGAGARDHAHAHAHGAGAGEHVQAHAKGADQAHYH